MKKTFLNTKLLSLLALSFVFIVACQKTQDTSIPSAMDDQLSTQLMNSTNFVYETENLDKLEFSDIIGTDNVQGKSASDECRTVTFVPSKDVYPHTQTITSNGCVNCNGSIVNGTRIIVFYVDPATAQAGDLLSEKTYQDYTVDGIKITGTVLIYLVSNRPHVLRVVTTKTLNDPGADGGIKKFTSNNVWKQIAGANTNDTGDDVYAIEGNSSGTEALRSGDTASFKSFINHLHPVINSNACCYNTMGTITTTIMVKSNGGYMLTEILDFGSGTCDNEATLTINGDAHTITLPLHFFPLKKNTP